MLRDGAYADRAFRSEAERLVLDPRERAFAQQLAYGAIQRLRTLDWAIERLAGRSVGAIDDAALDALRLGILQVVWLGGVASHAAVNEAVELAGESAPRARGFTNAVMRRAAREAADLVDALPDANPDEAALKHSHPDWLARMWWSSLGTGVARALMERDNEPAESALRANTLRAPRDAVVEALRAEGGDARPVDDLPEGIVMDGPFDVHGSQAFAGGLVMPQSRGSMLVARVVAPRPGERVLDMCAAPGAKSTHLAALMDGRGQVVASEVNAARADELAANCARLGAKNVSVRTGDARRVTDPEGFDRVLLDAPCSDLGTLQSRPDARWRKDERAIAELASLQQELLPAAVAQVRPGGVLVYSTCTISPAENRDQVARLLDDHSKLEADDLGANWPAHALDADHRFLQLLPHRDRTDGFFIARLRRAG